MGNRTRTAGYESGTDTEALVFGYEVADGDEDSDGVSVQANRLRLNGGTIKDEAENAAELAHEALATQAGAPSGRGAAGVCERGGGRLLSDADLRGGARRGIEAGARGTSRWRWEGPGEAFRESRSAGAW